MATATAAAPCWAVPWLWSRRKGATFVEKEPTVCHFNHFSPASTVDGKVYAAEVMEKHRAKELYEAARKQGKTAAHVGTK